MAPTAETAGEVTTRAKFRVQAVNNNTYGDGVQYSQEIRMSPVYSSDPDSENRAFWKATPNGSLHLWVDNPEVWGKFEVGQEYYLDLTLAPQAQA